VSLIATVPPHVPFLDEIAARWMAGVGDDPQRSGDGLILLPSRRAARALTEAFLRRADGRPLLLPRIAPLGSLDEAGLALSGIWRWICRPLSSRCGGWRRWRC
jgi:ATP-dependent helicase/nuclease subunit B